MWPNILAACYRSNIPSILVNGRMSARSCRAYRRIPCLSKPMFSQLTAVAAQTKADARRLQRLGAQNVVVSGNIKIDVKITIDLRKQAEVLAARWSNRGRRTVLIAASTHRGEDEQLLHVLQEEHRLQTRRKKWQQLLIL